MANEVARQLRKRMTPQEVRVWVRLRALRPQGLHFRRQMPIQAFIVDFACKPAKIIVEIDGFQHGMPGREEADRRRDEHLRSAGYDVLRFWNSDVERNIESVIDTIFAMASARLP